MSFLRPIREHRTAQRAVAHSGASDADAGTDAPSCPDGQTSCGTMCVDTTSDPANCGACGNACSASQVCNAGVCDCAAPTTLCGTECVILNDDPNNCGS